MAKKMRTRQVHHHRVSVFFAKQSAHALLPSLLPMGEIVYISGRRIDLLMLENISHFSKYELLFLLW